MHKIKKSPFFRSNITTTSIMRDVIIALLPVCIMAIINFGIKALAFMLVGIFTAVLFEYIVQKATKQKVTINDLSAAVTGLLLGLSFPVSAPLWIVVLATFVAIVLVKQLTGGIGKNIFNPAVFARVFIKVTLTPFFTDWVSPLPDLTSVATPLEYIGNGQKVIGKGAPSLSDLFFGNIGGGLGETVKWAIIIGFIYLVIRKIIDWKMPIATLAGLFLTALLFSKSDYNYALYHVLSGTVMFAAVFMVTDYTSGPLNPRARFYYALIIGIITGVLRYTLDLPGGIGVAILIMNLFAPMLDKFTTPRVFGFKRGQNIMASRK